MTTIPHDRSIGMRPDRVDGDQPSLAQIGIAGALANYWMLPFQILGARHGSSVRSREPLATKLSCHDSLSHNRLIVSRNSGDEYFHTTNGHKKTSIIANAIRRPFSPLFSHFTFLLQRCVSKLRMFTRIVKFNKISDHGRRIA